MPSSSAASWTSPTWSAAPPSCCGVASVSRWGGRWRSRRLCSRMSGGPRPGRASRAKQQPPVRRLGCCRPGGRRCAMSDVVAITGIAAGGDGVGRLADGRAVFVPRAAPGERVELKEKSLKLHRNYARAEVGVIVAGAAVRVAPPCPHYERDHCGGCQLQHLTYDAQLAAKRAIVGDALRRIGKFDIPDPELVEATEEWRYAAKIEMAVG